MPKKVICVGCHWCSKARINEFVGFFSRWRELLVVKRAAGGRNTKKDTCDFHEPRLGSVIATIKLDLAKKVAAVAMAEAVKRDWPMCISIVGPSGDLIYFEKMDECQYASISISQQKARAAARYRRPTLVFERLLGNSQFNAYLPTLGDAFIASRGGNPIVVNGKIIGAIGASGGTGAQDDTISQAGANSVK